MNTIIIADDHETVRDGLKSIVNEKNGYVLVAEAKNGLEAVELARKHNPKILLMDITMPQCDGLTALSEVMKNNRQTRVLMFSMHSNPEYIKEAFLKGAWGFLLKDAERSEIILALRKVAGGEKYFGNSVAQVILSNMNEDNVKHKAMDMLTKREIEIMKFVKQGLSNQEIADKLHVSKRTIDTHKTNIKSKLNISTSSSLVAYAHEIDL